MAQRVNAVARHPFRLPIIVLVSALLSAGFAVRPVTDVYANARYDYSISYPANLLKQEPEPDAGDGVTFDAIHGAAQFKVYASGTAEGINDTPEAVAKLAEEKCPGHRAAYRVVKHRLAAISCQAGANILYSKTLLRDDVATTLAGIYPVKERATWDSVVAAMASSMTAGHFLK